MATFGRVQTPDRPIKLDETVSEREKISAQLKALYTQQKTIEREITTLETKYKGYESEARLSVVVYDCYEDGDMKLCLASDGRMYRVYFKYGRLTTEIFTAPPAEPGSPKSLSFYPTPAAKKQGHRKDIVVGRGTSVMKDAGSMNDIRLWIADGAPEVMKYTPDYRERW